MPKNIREQQLEAKFQSWIKMKAGLLKLKQSENRKFDLIGLLVVLCEINSRKCEIIGERQHSVCCCTALSISLLF